MDEKKNSVADFLNNISEPNEMFSEEATNELEEPVEDKENKVLPFHKDPKVQKYVDKQIEKALSSRTAEQSFKKEVEEINLPSSFVELVGNDTPEKQRVLKDLSEYFNSLKGEARKEFMEEMKEQERQQVEADQRAQEELDNYFEEIEETFGVDISSNSASAKQTRAQFIDYVRKIAPKDANGEVSAFPDLVSSFEEFQERNKRPSSNRAKELASRGMTRSGDARDAVPQGRSWKDVDKFLDKLTAN